jgi:hypothetical protein
MKIRQTVFCSLVALAAGIFGTQSASAGTAILSDSLNSNWALDNFNADFTTTSPGAVTPSPITIGGITVTFDTGAYLAEGTTGSYAAPFLNQSDAPDTNAYLAAEPNANITIQYQSSQNDFKLLWGSVDSYNTLQFYNGTSLVTSFAGSDVIAAADGNQGYGGSRYVNVGFTGETFNKVVAISNGSPAFEFNIAAVPEPATWAMLLIGFFGVGFVVRGARRKDALAVA